MFQSLQDLSESRVSKLNSIWLLAAQIETSTLERSTQYLNHLSSEIPRNNPTLDSMMFVRHNTYNWQEPPDMGFEPSPVWLDDHAIVTTEVAKTFLRNVLMKSKGSLGQLKRDVENKRREVDNARRVKQSIREGKDKRDEVEVVRAIFGLQESLHEVERQKVTAEVEVSTITSAVGDVSVGAQNHNFKSETFKIPTNCDLCGDRIWGLSAKGFSCRDCGYTCHSKCEMKVPADCPGEQSKEEKKKLKTERQDAAHSAAPVLNGAAADAQGNMPRISRSDTVNSMNTLSSGYSLSAQRSISGTTMTPTEEESPAAQPVTSPRRSRILAPPPAHYISDGGASGSSLDLPKAGEQRGKMLYPYQQNGQGEITIEEGKDIVIVEPDGEHHLPTTLHNPGLIPCRRLRLDESPRRLPRRSRPGRLRRSRPRALAITLALPRAPGLDLQHLVRLARRKRHRQEEGAGRGAEARGEETQVRRGRVRLRGQERRRAQHVRGGEVRTDQQGCGRWVGGRREGGYGKECPGELYTGRCLNRFASSFFTEEPWCAGVYCIGRFHRHRPSHGLHAAEPPIRVENHYLED